MILVNKFNSPNLHEKIKIVIVLNHPEREVKTLEKIKRSLRGLNPGIDIYQIEYRNPNFMSDILDINPSIILTFPFTAVSTSYPFYILKYLLNCFIICFRVEGLLNSTAPNDIKELVGFERYGPNLVDYEIFWGKQMTEVVGSELLEQDKISSRSRMLFCGCPFFEDYCTSPINIKHSLPEKFSSRLTNYPKEKILLFVTGFHLADYTPQDIIIAGDRVNPFDDNKSQEQNYHRHLKIVEKLKLVREEWISNIYTCANEHTDLLFVVKMSPLEIIINRNKKIDHYTLLRNKNNILLINENIPFSDIISYCGILFHYGSTTSLEAYLSGVPSVYVNSSEFIFDFAAPTYSINISELPSIIYRHSRTPLPFQREKHVEDYLETQIDMKIGESYNPSEKIAKLLNSLIFDYPQTVKTDDFYLINAIKQVGVGLMNVLFQKAIVEINQGNYDISLNKHLNRLETISNAAHLPIIKLHFLKAICHLRMGDQLKAVEELHYELNINENDFDALSLLKQIDSSMNKI